MSACRAICVHSSQAARPRRGPAQQPRSALGSSWAFHQLVTAYGKRRPASSSLVPQPTAHQVDGQELFSKHSLGLGGGQGRWGAPPSHQSSGSRSSGWRVFGYQGAERSWGSLRTGQGRCRAPRMFGEEGTTRPRGSLERAQG